MARNFLGCDDKSAIVLRNIFPDSDLKFSTPSEFSQEMRRSGVYIEGNPNHQEIIFDLLQEILSFKPKEYCFGKWISVSPPDNDPPRTIIFYEALRRLKKFSF